MKSSNSTSFEPEQGKTYTHTHTHFSSWHYVCFGPNVWDYNRSVTNEPPKTKDQVCVQSTLHGVKRNLLHAPKRHMQTVGMATSTEAYSLHFDAWKYWRLYKNTAWESRRGSSIWKYASTVRCIAHVEYSAGVIHNKRNQIEVKEERKGYNLNTAMVIYCFWLKKKSTYKSWHH